MTRDFAKVTVKNAQPSEIEGLYTCPVTWLPERTHDLAVALELVDSNGMVLITAEWANNTHHARSVCDRSGNEWSIPAGLKTTY